MTFAKTVKRAVTALLAAVMIFAVIPFTSTAATADVQTVFYFLVEDMGLTPAAACGVLANIEYESEFDYNLYGDSGSSYGICQWHAERLTNMKNYCAKNGYSWQSLEGQLNFLKYELATNKSDTGAIIDKLKDTTNTAEGAYKAGYDWCYYFERPANKASRAENRGNSAMTVYWPKYGANYTKPTAISVGDVNGDSKIDSSDALIVMEASVGSAKLTAAQIKLADIDKDSMVNSSDALIILNIATGKDSVKNY